MPTQDERNGNHDAETFAQPLKCRACCWPWRGTDPSTWLTSLGEQACRRRRFRAPFVACRGYPEPTRIRIKQLAEELSYVVSPEASGLSGGSTGRVAVLVPTINMWFFSSVLAGIESVLREADMDTLIYHVDSAEDRRHFFDKLPARRKADAVIVIALARPRRRSQAAGSDGCAGRASPVDSCATTRTCGSTMSKSPIRRSATWPNSAIERIAMIRTEDATGAQWASDASRTKGFEMAMTEVGLKVPRNMLVTVPFGSDGGARAMDILLSNREPPTAVFAYSDEVAMGALRSLRTSPHLGA